MKCKLFDNFNRNLELKVNNWLEDNPNISICHVIQSATGAVLYLTIFYKESTNVTNWIKKTNRAS